VKYITIIFSLLLGTVYLTLECVILLFAINNRHYAYYYIGFGIMSFILLLVGRYLRERQKSNISKATYHIHMSIQVITVLVLIAATLVLSINYYLNEII
jgi:hypothetical protein